MFTREEALSLFKKYNKSESLYHHALSVESVMKEAARRYNEDEEYWALVGLLHDIDYEMFPDKHCIKAKEILKEINAPEVFIHAVCSHAYPMVEEKPELFMEKMLYAIDELTGLINATALMRPEKINGISEKSIMKKWKDKRFASGVNREIIDKGAQMLNLDRSTLIDIAITGMTKIKEELNL